MATIHARDGDKLQAAVQYVTEALDSLNSALQSIVSIPSFDEVLAELRGRQDELVGDIDLLNESLATVGRRAFLRRPVRGEFEIVLRYDDLINEASALGSEGIVFKCPLDTPVFAPCDLKIIKAGDSGPIWGYRVCGETPDGNYRIWLCHLDIIDLNVGDDVEEGEIIGRVGSTGNAKFPQLLFALQKAGDKTLPRGWKPIEGLTEWGGFVNPWGYMAVRLDSDVRYRREDAEA